MNSGQNWEVRAEPVKLTRERWDSLPEVPCSADFIGAPCAYHRTKYMGKWHVIWRGKRMIDERPGEIQLRPAPSRPFPFGGLSLRALILGEKRPQPEPRPLLVEREVRCTFVAPVVIITETPLEVDAVTRAAGTFALDLGAAGKVEGFSNFVLYDARDRRSRPAANRKSKRGKGRRGK